MKKILLLTALVGLIQTGTHAQIAHFQLDATAICSSASMTVTIYCDDPSDPCGDDWAYTFTAAGGVVTAGDAHSLTTWVGIGAPPATTPYVGGPYTWTDVSITENFTSATSSFSSSPIGCVSSTVTGSFTTSPSPCSSTSNSVDWTPNYPFTGCINVVVY